MQQSIARGIARRPFAGAAQQPVTFRATQRTVRLPLAAPALPCKLHLASQQQPSAILQQAAAQRRYSALQKPAQRRERSAACQAAAASPAGATGGTSTFTQAVFNILNILVGVGLLSVPFALKQAGWIGLALLWGLGIITNYTGKALVECHATVTKTRDPSLPRAGYEDIAEAAFGALGRLIIANTIYVEMFGTCCLLMILEGDNLFNLFGSRWAASAKEYMLLAAAAIIPTVWLPSLSALAPLGAAGVTASMSVAALVGYTLLSGAYTPGAATVLVNWATLPMVFGIMAFVYSGHGVFPAIQASMKEPQKFPQALNVAYVIVATLCTVIGVSGYYMYGANVADVIAFNLPKGLLATICGTVILVNPVAKFAITMEPVAAAAERAANGGVAAEGVKRAAIRTAVALATLTAARNVPFLASLMALIGSFLTIGVSVVFPAACHLKLHAGSASVKRIAWNWFVIAVGCVCAASGTAASLKNLAAKAAAAAM